MMLLVLLFTSIALASALGPLSAMSGMAGGAPPLGAVSSVADPASLAGVGSSVGEMLIPGIKPFIRRDAAGGSSPMYDRKTQTPVVWIHLRKAAPIVVDREFYDISKPMDPKPVKDARTEAKEVLARAKPHVNPPMQQMVNKGSLIQTKGVDTTMIQNGLYLSMPLRQPPQETMNVAGVEDGRRIQGVADYLRKKREIARLEAGFSDVIRGLVTDSS